MIDTSKWIIISDYEKTNENFLVSWENAGTDDGIIKNFLEKVFIKERTMFILFLIIVMISSALGIIELLMLSNDTYMLIFIAAIGALASSAFFKTISERISLRKVIDEKRYDVCDCTAFDIDTAGSSKYCSVKDINGTVLMLQKGNQPPAPMRVKFIGYFPDKDYDARIIRVNYLRNTTVYYAFSSFYLSGKKQ